MPSRSRTSMGWLTCPALSASTAFFRAGSTCGGFKPDSGTYPRSPPVFRALEQLHGDEERVHIHVQNARVRFGGALPQLAMFRSKSRQLWHSASVLLGRGIRHKAGELP